MELTTPRTILTTHPPAGMRWLTVTLSARQGKWRNGRRARFRSVCPKGRGGSTPPLPTSSQGIPPISPRPTPGASCSDERCSFPGGDRRRGSRLGPPAAGSPPFPRTAALRAAGAAGHRRMEVLAAQAQGGAQGRSRSSADAQDREEGREEGQGGRRPVVGPAQLIGAASVPAQQFHEDRDDRVRRRPVALSLEPPPAGVRQPLLGTQLWRDLRRPPAVRVWASRTAPHGPMTQIGQK